MNSPTSSWNPLVRWPWLWCVAAFLALLAAWTAFIIIATKHPTADALFPAPAEVSKY